MSNEDDEFLDEGRELVSARDRYHVRDRRKVFKWISSELIVTIVVLGCTGFGAFTNVKSDVRDNKTHMETAEQRIAKLEAAREEDHNLLLRIEGTVNAIKATVEERR